MLDFYKPNGWEAASAPNQPAILTIIGLAATRKGELSSCDRLSAVQV